jgi:signal transduction histidine kinase
MNRGKPWLYYAICALGLPLYLWAFQLQAHISALPRDFPPAHIEYPIRLTGPGLPPDLAGRAVGSRDELRFLSESLPPNTRLQVVSSSGAAADVSLPRALSVTGLIVTFVSGIFFWAVSSIFFASRASPAPVRDFFWSTILYGFAIMIGGVHHPSGGGWPVIMMGLFQLTCLVALPPIFVHMALSFPRRQAVLDRTRWLMPALGGVAAGQVLWQAVAFLRYFYASSPARATALFPATVPPQVVADTLLVTQVLAGFLILFTSGRKFELKRERAQVKWLLWGFAVGVIPYVYLRTLPQLFGLTAPFNPAFDRLFELSIPIAFVFAVVRHQFLDIDIIIRRSVIYAILALLMVGLYLTFGVLIGRRVEPLPGETALIAAIGIGVGAGLMFQPLRRAIGKAVDRTFFKLAHGYGQALADLGQHLARVPAQADLIRVVDEFLSNTLHPQKHGVVLMEQGEVTGFGNLPPEQMPRLAEAAGSIPPRALGAPNSTSDPEIESDSFPEAFTHAGAVLVTPLRVNAETSGVILLGRKQTERRYVEPDLELLRATALEASRALERIRLVQTATAEADARQRAEELDRLKSDFLSRVAHDLRTPLASILWSTDNLLDGIAGTIGEHQAEYLRSVKASASHLNRLVSNLLEISRLEQGRTQLDLGLVDLGDVLAQADLTLRPLAEEKGIALAIDIRDHGPVQGHAEKLLEVVLNLVDNAIKFSPRGAAVDVIVERATPGHVDLSVRDRGPGLGDLDAQVIFQRFRQGEHSRSSQQHGFGLGLYIVKSYVELMRGEVIAANRDGGGAVFSCRLPLHSQAHGGAHEEKPSGHVGGTEATGAPEQT